MALYPFLTLHMKSLGIGLVEIGMQFAITPLAVFVATPLIGLLADRIGNFRWMIVVSLLLSALVGQMILYVPKVQKVSVCSVEQQRFRFTCPNSIEGENERDDFFMLKVPTCFVPTSRSGSETNRMLSTGIHNIQFSQCTVVCANKTLPISLQRERPASSDSSSVWWDPPAAKLPSYCLHSEEKRVEHCLTPTWNEIKGDPSSTDTLSLNVSLSANQVRIGSRPLRASDAATNTNKNEQASVVKNNSQNPSKPDANFLSSVTNTISQVIPTPASSASASSLIVSATPGASVSLIDPNKIESKDPLPDATSSTNENVEPAPRFENAANSLPILNPPGTSATDIKRDDELHKTTESGTVNAASKKFTEILPSTLANSAQTAAAAGPITLLEGVITSIERQSAHSNDPLRHYQTIRCNSELHEDCHISCPIHADDRLPDMQQQLVDDPISHHITFWLYLLLRIMMSIIIATEMSMLKAAILTLVEKHDSEYGFQRMWASVSVAFVPLCTGILMDRLIASGNFALFNYH